MKMTEECIQARKETLNEVGNIVYSFKSFYEEESCINESNKDFVLGIKSVVECLDSQIDSMINANDKFIPLPKQEQKTKNDGWEALKTLRNELEHNRLATAGSNNTELVTFISELTHFVDKKLRNMTRE